MKLRTRKDWKIAGKPLKRLDTADKLTGKLVYAIDVKLPGMLTATIMEPGVRRQARELRRGQGQGHARRQGRLQVGDTAVAVVADTFWQAKKALDALRSTWEEGPNDKVSSETIAATCDEGLTAKDGVFVGNKAGDAACGDRRRRQEGRGRLLHALLDHATMEPMNCTAKWTADKCEVWVATQNGEASLAALRGGRRACRLANARSTSTTSAAASAGAASRTTSPRPCCSPSRSRACR